MNNNNAYYERNKERVHEKARNRYHPKGDKEKSKKYLKK